MSRDRLEQRYLNLDAPARHIIQLCAIHGSELDQDEIQTFSARAGWKDSKGKPLRGGTFTQVCRTLETKGLLARSAYRRWRVSSELLDFVFQDCIRSGLFDALADAVQQERFRRHYLYSSRERDLRIAFYRGDVKYIQETLRGESLIGETGVLDPFSRDIFDRLDPVLQEMYLIDVAPTLVLFPQGDESLVLAMDDVLSRQTPPSNDLLAAWLDLAVARGDLESLDRIDAMTQGKHREITGCRAMLRGDFDAARSLLAEVLGGARRRGKLKAMNYLPAILYLLLLFRDQSAESMREATTMIGKLKKSRKDEYSRAFPVLDTAVAFANSPSPPAALASDLLEHSSLPLCSLLAGYFMNWLIDPSDNSSRVRNLAASADAYAKCGLHWLAAEADGILAKKERKASGKRDQRGAATHARLGTASLVDMVQPEPLWQRSLVAIAGITQQGPAEAAPVTETERLIWELFFTENSLDLSAYHQKRTAKGWTKGRKVGMRRLFEQFSDPEFSFLSEQDREICRAIEVESDRNYYGYMETDYFFDDVRVARALIGHPRVFRMGDRDTPLEIVERQPRLIVSKANDDTIELALDPTPKCKSYENRDLRVLEGGPTLIEIVLFSEQHLRLHQILGKKLTVPTSAANRVHESIASVASLIAVHSQIDGAAGAGEVLPGDPRPHIHLMPYQDGLRVELFTRPFGETGPLCRPGQGGANVYAQIDGCARTVKRDFAEEIRRRDAAISACGELAARADIDSDDISVSLPSACEALEALVQLEDLVAAEDVVLHWPQGRTFDLAGRASESQFQVRIHKDRDWFAASGTLKVDQSLSVDMMELIDLIEASGATRFVKLNDGRFLALTEKLRRRVEELAAYGDRRSNQDKLRFPRARAAVLDQLSESVKLRSDSHWKECVRRMREAETVEPEVPSTMQAELRDYQIEGFRWLARLAAWGVGGCLADDMGLGKTIEALALILHRAAEGPTLVVAPTSVVLNWLTEAKRFAPSLNVHVLGEGDRAATLDGLGPRDLVLCSYGLLHIESERLGAQPWHTVVLDEAQAIKNTTTRRSRAAMGLQADFRLIMTGTPLENHLGELWNLMEFINPGLLGSIESFRNRYATPIERDGCRETRRRLKRLIQPFILRRTKSQVLEELPARTELTLQVELSEEEASFYEALRQRAVEKLAQAGEDGPGHMQIFAELTRLRRACCHPSLILPDCGIAGSKLAIFSEMVDELLDNGHKVLVFSQFVDHLTILREELDRKGVTYHYLDGSTPARKRKERVEAFQSGDGDVFLISLKAGGLGLNLTAADYVIHMDPWWNPAVEDQASDRAHRMGQTRPVTIYRLVTQGTIEERISELHASKRDLADSLLEGADISGKLSSEELLKLIRN